MTWFRVGGAGIPATLKNAMNAVFNKKFGTSGQNYAPKGWPDDVNLLGKLPEKTVSGAIANITDGADEVPLKELIFSASPVQASGTPSPSNPLPISGHTELNGVHCGKNLFDKDHANVVNGYIDVSAFNTGNANAKTIYIPIKCGVTYTVSKTVGARFSIATSNVIPSSGATFTSMQAGNTSASLTITAGANDTYLWAWVYLNGTDTGTLEEMLASVQIEVGNQATTYAPYSAESKKWEFGQTVYSGQVNALTGEVEIGYALYKVTSFTGLWNVSNPNGTAVYATIPTAKHVFEADDNMRSNIMTFSTNPRTSLPLYSYNAYDGTNTTHTFCLPSSVTTLAEANQWLANQTDGLYIIIKLADPIEIDMDSVDWHTQLGDNNFFNNCGDTSCTYRQDIALALAALQNSRGLMMASRPVTQLIGEESDPDQVNELVENDETEQEGEDNAR